MKRFVTLLVICLMTSVAAITADAGKFGLTGGTSFMGIKNVGRGKAIGFQAGVTYKFKLPAGFAIQPSLLYHQKSSKTDDASYDLNTKIGYLELPISFQWGPDLLLFRPFLDVSPFVGYGLYNNLDLQSFDTDGGQTVLGKDSWSLVNRLEYGLGLGAGLEIWKFQFVCRYNWNFGSLLNPGGKSDASSVLKKGLGNNNFGGVTLSLALLF